MLEVMAGRGSLPPSGEETAATVGMEERPAGGGIYDENGNLTLYFSSVDGSVLGGYGPPGDGRQ